MAETKTEAVNRFQQGRNQIRAHELLDVLDQVYRSAKFLADNRILKWEQVPTCCKLFLDKHPLIKETLDSELYASTCRKYGVVDL
jgi:hypothetical protein